LSSRANFSSDRRSIRIVVHLPSHHRGRHKLGQVCAEASNNHANRGAMRGFHNSSFDPQTLVLLEAAFDEAWLTLKSIGNTTVRPHELAFGCAFQ
jgi:hypothetical protein